MSSVKQNTNFPRQISSNKISRQFPSFSSLSRKIVVNLVISVMQSWESERQKLIMSKL